MFDLKETILTLNRDYDIYPDGEEAIEANKFSLSIIPFIIKDDLDNFIKIISNNGYLDSQDPIALKRFYLSDYLYQRFFDLLTRPNILSVAAFFNAENIVDFLLSLPNVDKTDSFHYACASGNLNIVKKLAEKEKIDMTNKDDLRPIHVASYFGNVDVVKYLYVHGCKILTKNDEYSCINKAAFNGSLDVLKFFHERKENVFNQLYGFQHPIISAAIGGQLECVNYFIDRCRLSKQVLLTALNEACKKGSLSCVKALVREYTKSKNKNKSLPFSPYEMSVENLNIDVLQFLFTISIPDEINKLLITLIKEKYDTPISKNPQVFKCAKLILKNCSFNPFDDFFFQEIVKEGSYLNALLLFKEINFSIKDTHLMTESQIQFCKLAILHPNSNTVAFLYNLFKNCQTDFLAGQFQPDDITNSFLYNLNFSSKDIYMYGELLFLTHFPFSILVERKNLIQNKMIDIFFIIFLEHDMIDNAKKIMPSYEHKYLKSILIAMNKRFNPSKNNKIHSLPRKLKTIKSFCIYFKQLNEQETNDANADEFNIFEYQCKNEEEQEIYDKFMSLIKLFIRHQSNNCCVMYLLCENGLNRNWINREIKNEEEQSKSNNVICENKSSKYKIKKKYYSDVNPLINLVLRFSPISEKNFIYTQLSYELLIYTLRKGIDLSFNTYSTSKIWKYVIKNQKGFIARLLIEYGHADCEFELDKNFLQEEISQDSISLFDYALLKKAINIIYVFLCHNFYPQQSLINVDPNQIIEFLNAEKSDQRDKNLKIMALIYKYRRGNFNEELKNQVINELRVNLKMNESL